MPNRAYPKTLVAALIAVSACLAPASALGAATGGAAYKAHGKATVVNGKAIAPSNAPEKVKQIIAAANKIVEKPYRYGGGHGSFNDSAYDCSGSVSFALHGANLISRPMNSSEFMGWARRGEGKWVTVYANNGHAFMVVAGLRLDTGYRDSWGKAHGAKPGSGPRWGKPRPTGGYTARHPGI
jgi:cell wall-associated NlpC family hydrolase